MALDTGSSRTTLSELPESARPAGTEETADLHGPATVARWLVDRVRLGSLQAGPLMIHALEAGPRSHAFMGLDVLGTGPWQLDVANQELIIGVPVPAASTLTLTATGHLVDGLSFSGVHATALFDTGAGIAMIDRRFADAHPDLFEPADRATATDSTGAASEIALARESTYEIERIAFFRAPRRDRGAAVRPQINWTRSSAIRPSPRLAGQST